MKIYLEDVFKTSGIPTYTFVKPPEYTKLLVALRTRGRGLVVEGPSGIGKTTCISKAIEELNLNNEVLILSARKIDDREYIKEIPRLGNNLGIIIIDDFHRLDQEVKRDLADFMKTLADEEVEDTKLILIGINKAGDTLIKFADDLNNRIDTIRFEVNPEDKKLKYSEGETAMFLNMDVISKEGSRFNAFPGIALNGKEVRQITDTVIAQSLVLKFNKVIDEKEGKLEIGIKESQSLTTLLTLKVLEFPMIKFLWLGVVVMCIGFIMSVVQRIKKLKNTNS